MAISPEHKMAAPDRILVLEPFDGMKPLKGTQGIPDVSLFTGSNKLHALMDMETCLWTLRYEKGAVPPALQNQKYTSFSKAKKAVDEYFAKRNIKVTEIKHNY